MWKICKPYSPPNIGDLPKDMQELFSRPLLTNDGEIILRRDDGDESDYLRIAITPAVQPKKGNGNEAKCEIRDKLAQDIVDFLNSK